MDKQQLKQLGDVFLTDPITGDHMLITSTLQANEDGNFSFIVTNPKTGNQWLITARIEEIGKEKIV